MKKNEIYDVIILGGGPAGLTAGIYAQRAALKTVLIEKGIAGGQVALTKDVENYPGFINLSGSDLCEKFLNHAKHYDLEIINKEAVATEPGVELHSVKLDDGTILQAHAIILATGGSAKKLTIPGEDENYGQGVSYCATCDGFFFRNQVVAVVGGGDTALEDALYLSKITKKVYLIHRRGEFRGSKILQQRVFAEPQIQIIYDTVATKVLSNPSLIRLSNDSGVKGLALKNVKTGEESTLETDGVFIFVGFTPNSALVPAGVKLNTSGYVITDEKCETSLPGIFAIGDLRQKYANQIVLAAADGCTAALAAAHYVETRKGK